MERGKFLLAEDDLIKQEQQLAKEKTDMALQRLRKEEMKAKRAIRQHAKRQKYDIIVEASKFSYPYNLDFFALITSLNHMLMALCVWITETIKLLWRIRREDNR